MVQARLHRTERYAQRLGDLLETQIVDEPQQQEFALRSRESVQAPVHVRGGVRCGGRRQHVLEVVDVDRRAPRANAVQAAVLDHRVEEGRELGGEGEAGESAEQVRERVLQHIERIVAIAGEAI